MHPFQALLMCAVCTLLMAVAGLRLLAMYTEGTVSLIEITIYAMLVLAALGGTLYRWGTVPGVLLGLAFVGLCLGLPVFQRIADQRLADRLVREDVAECHRILRFDPNNAAAYMRLGDICLRVGDLDTAVAVYQRAVELAPRDNAMRQALGLAIERKRRQDVHSRFCPQCRTENPSRATYCRQCGTTLNVWAEIRQGLGQITPTQVLIGAGVVAGACLLLACAGVILPRTAAILVGISLILAAALHLAVRPLP
jgi:ribosomal protein L40E